MAAILKFCVSTAYQPTPTFIRPKYKNINLQINMNYFYFYSMIISVIKKNNVLP